MTTATRLDAVPLTGRIVPSTWAWLRFGLLALFVAIALAMVTLGVRPASFTALAVQLGNGTVREVTVVNSLGPGMTGTSTVEIRWHDGLLPRYSEVRQTWPSGGREPNVQTSEPRSLQKVNGDIGRYLRQYANAPITVKHVQDHSTVFHVVEWRVPGWVVFAALAAFALLIGLLITCPEPLLATRWAWFWAITSPVFFLAIPAFLLFGIPRTGTYERDYSRHGRLTGGWAFILFAILIRPVSQLVG